MFTPWGGRNGAWEAWGRFPWEAFSASADAGWPWEADVDADGVGPETVDEVGGDEERPGGTEGEEGEVVELRDVEGWLVCGFVAEDYGEVVPDDEDSEGE